MSRIGKQPVPVPAGVEVTIDGQLVKVKGSKGQLSHEFLPEVRIVQETAPEGEVLKVEKIEDTQEASAFHGLSRTLLSNMVVGVSDGFSKKLEIQGVGYRAALKGNDLELQLGYSHPVFVKAPEGISFELPNQTQIIVKGIDKQQVGQTAADIRKWRKPEPYKGKGIRYEGEHVRRKMGKTATGAS
ncbi:MAG: 50S ribosomal protein L6 [Coriobacteriales bacterium]|jgi:large subunit ribosomal protein L6|nr:50S ribosomal protein L6 [Coriobacteriales bacterium]